MLSIREPPGLFNSALLLTRRSTNPEDGSNKPLILIDHRSELPCSQSPGSFITNGTRLQVKVYFDIEVFRFDVDGLPRVDILLGFDELLVLPRTEGATVIKVTPSQYHSNHTILKLKFWP